MEKRWVYRNPLQSSFDNLAEEDGIGPVAAMSPVQQFAESIKVSETLATLLYQRGICTFDSAREFFRPSLDRLHNPFLMKDMDLAVSRLERAMLFEEHILIYGDYDVDGTTAVALFYGFLRTQYAHLQFYIPDRYTEGYGISQKGIDWAKEHGYTLIVSLDCGIKSTSLIAYAKTLGIDFIICDHHRPDDQLPDAVAVLDPKRSDCSYPFDELSGCGVGFKLLQAYCIRKNIPLQKLYPFTDLLVVSIAADIVPIVGENRIFAYFGLQQLSTNPRPGLKALMQIAGFASYTDISSVVFGLSPRINAAGRVAHANAAVQLLLSEEEAEANRFAQQININNTDRRGFDTSITKEALDMIEKDDLLRTAKSTVLFKNDWHKGVVGIVASRCIEKYHRPTIILTESQDKASGSARSVPGFDVYEAIEECSDLLEQFGGHMYAAGLSLKVENIPAFRRRFEEVVARRITPEQLTPLIEIDLKMPLSKINRKFFQVLQQMAPFGPQNMQPVFVSENVRLKYNARILKEQHLKLSIIQDDLTTIDAIGFKMAGFYERVNSGEPFHICYQIEENNFNNKTTLQLNLRDIKFGEVIG